jgi:spore coat polysaccharide biosynthesis protein SpsF
LSGPGVTAIVQARMSSSRAPGTMLRAIAGKPVLTYVLERLEHCSAITEIVVATSEDRSDDALAAYCAARRTPYVRGPLDDVAARFVHALDGRVCERFARICGDRVLLDTRLIEHAASIMTETVDLVTNAYPRTFPSGQMTEVVRADTFRRTYPKMTRPEEREHVTRYFYQHSTEFNIVNFARSVPATDVHLAIDTDDDIERFGRILQRMVRPHWTYGLDEVIQLYREVDAR